MGSFFSSVLMWDSLAEESSTSINSGSGGRVLRGHHLRAVRLIVRVRHVQQRRDKQGPERILKGTEERTREKRSQGTLMSEALGSVFYSFVAEAA